MSVIRNPIFELVITLNKYNNIVINDSKFEMLVKNFNSNLRKVFYGTLFISNVQKDEIMMSNYGNILKTETVEHMFYKISTTWDLAYQIGNFVVPLPKGTKSKTKYELLQEEFDKYCESNNLNRIDFRWYKQFSQLRNRIVHGGKNLIVYYEDKRIKFQIYDNNVDEIIDYNDFYNDGQRSLIFADYYFTYYTILLNNYLYEFFKFITQKFIENNTEKLCEFAEKENECFINMWKSIEINDDERFKKLIDEININKKQNEKYDFYYR